MGTKGANKLEIIGYLTLLISGAGCGTRVGTGVTIRSAPFAIAGVTTAPQSTLTALADDLFRFSSARTAAPSVTDFKFCLKALKLEADDGKYADKDGSGSVEFKVGLLDVSNGQEKVWATSNLPTGFRLRRIKAEVHKDFDVCNVNYSVKFNGFESQNDVEFKFKFEPPVDVTLGTSLRVALSSFVAALRAAASSASLNENNLKDYVEGLEESGTKDSGPFIH